ncbi:DUF1697 domain-containing protein [Microbacterium deminutum]|uniref:DUF1697 domain-containing protein n=1 Tax=Microbacterium deminutum TaxID=344164 RepID=UPI0031D67396
MRWVALLRNVNQGQRGNPSTADIRAGFTDAGCRNVELFQSNGTVLFDADDPVEAAERASAGIAARSGHEREVYCIALASLAEAVDRHRDATDLRRYEFTLHGGGDLDPTAADVRKETDRHRCEIVDSGPGWAIIHNRIDGEGHATPVLESLTGGPATSRGLPTLVRLVSRFIR